jgi:hypothetical protein
VLNEDAVEELFVQLYDAIVLPWHAVALADTVREGLVQVIGPLFVAATVGRQVSTASVVQEEAVHPLPD